MEMAEIIALLGGAAAAWPIAARAQQLAMPVVGFLHAESLESSVYRVAAFRRGMNGTGYFESQNVAVEYHWAEGRYDLFPQLAAELVRRQVTVKAMVAELEVDEPRFRIEPIARRRA